MLNQKNNKIRNKKNHRGKLFFSFKKSIKDTSSFIKKIYKIKIKFEKIDKMNLKVYGLSKEKIKNFITEKQILINHNRDQIK